MNLLEHHKLCPELVDWINNHIYNGTVPKYLDYTNYCAYVNVASADQGLYWSFWDKLG